MLPQRKVEGTNFIVETHSESLMLRIQRMIRVGQLSPADISVIYVEPNVDGSGYPQELRLDEDGEFVDEWPSGFFEERFDEVFPADDR